MAPNNAPHNALRHHVTGAIERGEAEPIFARDACPDCGGETDRPGPCGSCDQARRYDAASDEKIAGSFTRDEWNTLAEVCDLLAGLDEGEHTDYDAIVALRDDILRIPGVH